MTGFPCSIGGDVLPWYFGEHWTGHSLDWFFTEEVYMTAERSQAEVDRLVTRGTILRNMLYKEVKGRPGFEYTHPDFWPESWEKEAVSRLWEAHLFSQISAKSAERKYNLLREAIAYAEAEITNHQRMEA